MDCLILEVTIVILILMRWVHFFNLSTSEDHLNVGRVLYRRTSGVIGSTEKNGEVFFIKVGHPNLISPARLIHRAKSRIARQRIEVGLPLSKIVNVRKELYSELKVSCP